MQLRPYQQESIDAVYRHLRERDDNPVVVIPTAGGKTPILATICRDAIQRWDGRVLVVERDPTYVDSTTARSVGGIRASIYNAMPREGVTALRDLMLEFRENRAP